MPRKENLLSRVGQLLHIKSVPRSSLPDSACSSHHQVDLQVGGEQLTDVDRPFGEVTVSPLKRWWQLGRITRPPKRRPRPLGDNSDPSSSTCLSPGHRNDLDPCNTSLEHNDNDGVSTVTSIGDTGHYGDSIHHYRCSGQEDDSPVMWRVERVPPGANCGNCGNSPQLVLSGANNGANSSPSNKTIAHTQVDYQHCLVPDLASIAACPYYWGEMDRYAAETLLQGKADGSFLLRDSAQDGYIFSVSFRRYNRSLHARIEQLNNRFSFDSHDNGVFSAHSVTHLIEHYKDPNRCLFFEPMLTLPINRINTFSLQHMCRATICNTVNNDYDSLDHLSLPKPMLDYLRYYHYKKTVCVRVITQIP